MGFGYDFPPVPPEPLTVLGNLACDGVPVLASTEGTGSTLGTYYGTNQGASDVAYSITLAEPTSITLSTCESSFDTFLHLYTADGEMLGEEIASCDDCGSCASGDIHAVLSSLDGTIPSTLPAGKRYY